METQKWVNLGLLIGSAIVFLFLVYFVGFVWDVARLPRFDEWPVSADVLVAFVLAAGVGVWTRRWEKANRFFNEVAIELSKVTWPVRKETVASSGVVVVLVGVAALLLTTIDLLWGTMARGVFHF